MALTLDTFAADKPLCENAFGHFRLDGREFVITDLATPMPWTNVMSHGHYGLVISQTGGGFSWGDNCQINRVTRWDQDLVQDLQGRFVYLQDLEAPETVWSTTLKPTIVEATSEEVVHGLGYTTYTRTVEGIQTVHTVFVPEDSPCEVWIVMVRNLGRTPRKLRLASYLEWHLGAAGDWHREFHRLFYSSGREKEFMFTRKVPGLLPESREIEPQQPLAFHGLSGMQAEQWIADKGSFLGNPADLSQPGFLIGHRPEEENPRVNDPIASIVGTLDLAAGEEKCISFTVGSVQELKDARQLAKRFTPDQAIFELARVRHHWASFCDRSHLDTGDNAVDLMNNYWLKYQTLGARMTARCAYYQQGGAYGFRDQLQDSLGMLTLDPELARNQIIRHAEATYADGGVRHWWHPGTNIFVESHHSDTCLWIAHAVLSYLDETNDLSILNKPCRYLDRTSQKFGSEGTLLDHCYRGIERTLSLRSERGLPLIFSGDWNDGLSHAGVEGRGESVWLGMFLFDILSRWIPLLQDIGEGLKASEFIRAREEIQKAVNDYGWDGQWYLQGTRDDGLPLGSSKCEEGKIFLNPQAWSVISGIGPFDRSASALGSARDLLVRPYGAQLLAPAFTRLDPYIGYITRYAPGLRENGGVYSHASTWMIQALAMMGWADDARALYRAMIPCNGRCAAKYGAEPYVMPGNVDGPDSPFEGRAGWTWYTGSSAWMYRIAFDWICGIRASRGGLIVAPQSGTSPLNFKMKRSFRGDVFRFEVSGVGSAVSVECPTADIVDGKLQSTGTGAEHRVFVGLG